MIVIKHRVNTIKGIKKTPIQYGVEIDLRSSLNSIHLHHDPFKKGVKFAKWIKFFNHKLLVLNVKEEGLENKILSILNFNNIKNFFFHDQTFSSMLKNMKKTNVSIRYSEFEKIKDNGKLFKYIKWVWIDNFTHLPKNKIFYKFLKKQQVKTCIVSPELVKLSRSKEIQKLKKEIKKKKYHFDAVCTKKIDLWNSKKNY